MGNFKPQNEEILEIFDEDNQSLGIFKTRSEVHKDFLFWHRVVTIWIINDKGEILCQKQNYKKMESASVLDKWIPNFGGHINKGEEFLETAKRELEEEIGLQINDKDLEFLEIRKSKSFHKHFVVAYILKWNGNLEDLKFNDDEITDAKWFSYEDIKKMREEEKLGTTISEKIMEYMKKNF